jgi:ATP-dependent helicase/nuclease subunit A
MNRTEAQRSAIETHDKNLIVVAGAGSGKTYVLVNRYLALLEANPDWALNQQVAITFTQKAAQEMRERVRVALEEHLNQATNPADVTRWAGRLAEMDSARIDTIHGLCTALLHTNAAEAGVDPAFDVLDETEAQILLDDVLDAELRRLVNESDPALALFTEYGAGGVRAALRAFIAAEFDDLPPNLIESWVAGWQADAVAALDRLVRHPAFVEAVAWQPPGGWRDGNDALLSVWQACHRCLSMLTAPDQPLAVRFAALTGLKGAINLRGGSASYWGDKAIVAEAKEMLRRLRDMADEALKLIGEPPNHLDARAAELLPLWVGLLRRVRVAYSVAKAERGVLDFDDLEARARALLRDHDGVRARYLGAEFRHVLVDEFQDTNAAQWDIIQRLADPAQPGSLFLVGDAKQSIYAFRGADVSVFERVRHQLTDAQIGGEQIPLARSFRTHRPLVDLFNRVFAQILTRDEDSPVRAYQIALGDPMEAARDLPPSAEAPLVEFLLVEKEGADGNRSADDRRRLEAAAFADHFRALVEGGEQVYDRAMRATRPMRYGDIALLFQSMKHVTLYEDALKAQGLPYVTAAGRGYYDRQEVWDCINLLRALHRPADHLALASALRSPLFGLSDDALLALRLYRPAEGDALALWDALPLAADIRGIDPDEVERIAFAAATLRDLRESAGRVTIADLLRAALARTGYLATLTGLPDGARLRGNIEKLLDLAQTSGHVTLGSFSHYLNDLSKREVREGEALVDAGDAMTLMTVHRSKGLEFPLVALVDTSWGRGSSGDGGLLIHDAVAGLCCKVLDAETNTYGKPYAYRRADQLAALREEAERKRLLYVAMTRAQDRLVIGGQADWDDETGAWAAKGWLGWLLPALAVAGMAASDDGTAQTSDGQVRLRVVGRAPAAHIIPSAAASIGWDAALPAAAAFMPPLLQPLPREYDAPARSLTATQIASLGSAFHTGEPDSSFYRLHFRRSVWHGAPAHIARVAVPRAGVSGRKIGEIVHRALRWGRFPMSDADMTEMLRSYAWQEGIVEPERLNYAVKQARADLKLFASSDVFRWLKAAQQVYRELPFIFQTDRRTIYGVLDVLLQHPDGSWAVIDYKTGFAEPGTHARHAERYDLQVGVYAAAVSEQLRAMTGREVVPAVHIHYIRYSKTVTVPEARWRSAVERLESYIGDLTGNES